MMGITLKGLRGLRTKLNNLGGNSTEAIRMAIAKTVALAEESAKANVKSGSGSQADSGGSGSLHQSITSEVKQESGSVVGRVYTKAPHAAYVEFGTGPVGAANHAGISPHVPVSWTPGPWKYKSGPKKGDLIPGGGWIYCDEQGNFHYTSGQPARPYLYPAAVEHEDTHNENIRRELVEAIRRAVRGG